MARRRKKAVPTEPVTVRIESLSHDGRGIAHYDGKTLFVDNALPEEVVEAQYTGRFSKYDEAKAIAIETPSEQRAEPACEHFSICGGCSMQHLDPGAQLSFKQEALLEQLEHFGQIQPEQQLAPLTRQSLGYRRKARLGVKYVAKKERVLVGFREKRSSFLADINQCSILHPVIANLLQPLQVFILTLDAKAQIPQLEVAVDGDEQLAIVVRHLSPLSEGDAQAWVAFAQLHGFHLYLQPKGPSTVHKVWPEDGVDRLHYRHKAYDANLAFHPMDFTQVNQEINEAMVPLALKMLDVGADDRVLDLFCGLGNFTIPLARLAKAVVGVEGDAVMVERGYENARANGLDNVDFFSADLFKDFMHYEWAKQPFNKILIDPPRSGAQEVVKQIGHFNVNTIVYVSCNPSTLARDAGELKKQGYRLKTAGIMDMFPHTSHVESIALFEK